MSIQIFDKTLREIQAEECLISTEVKKYYMQELVFSGIKNIELTNVGSPITMPQFSDAGEVIAAINDGRFLYLCEKKGIDLKDINFSVIAVSRKASQRALEIIQSGAKIKTVEMTYFLQDERQFNNSGLSCKDYTQLLAERAEQFGELGVLLNVRLGGIWREQTYFQEALIATETAFRIGAANVVHADDGGFSTIDDVKEYIDILSRSFDLECHIFHFHHQHNTEKKVDLDVVWAAQDAGISKFEATIGGIGGQPANFIEGQGPIAATGPYVFSEYLGATPLEDLAEAAGSGLDVGKIRFLGHQLERTLGRRLYASSVDHYFDVDDQPFRLRR